MGEVLKVLSLSNGASEAEVGKACKHYQRVRAMPCELIDCYDAQTVKEHIDTADVVLVATPMRIWPPFWNEVADLIEQSKAFVGMFLVDSYTPLWREGQKPIANDAVLYSFKELYFEHHEDDGETYRFWTPACWDVQESVDKDIDILVWGNNGLPSYPFRDFILHELRKYVVGEPVIEDDEIIVCDLFLDGAIYKYYYLPYKNKTYWSDKLATLVSRTKICCTGSAGVFAPVGKYFINAACGAITLTNDFSDREQLGFEHGKHLWITNKENFIDDLTLLLHGYDIDSGVDDMSINARQLIADRHTPAIRGQELYQFLVNATGVK